MLRFLKGSERQVFSSYNLNYLHKARNKNMLVTSYQWPDLDGLGSAYALAELLTARGNNAKPMKWREPQNEAMWAMNRVGVNIPDIVYGTEDIILVDVSDPEEIPEFLPHNKVKAVIDHRLYYCTEPFMEVEDICIEPVGAASTLICGLYMDMAEKPTILAADMLYLAIMSNTIKCKSRNTTDKDREAISWLKAYTSMDISVVDEMFYEKSKIINLKKTIVNDLANRSQLINNKNVAVAQLEIVDSVRFLLKNKAEIIAALECIRQERKADDIFLIVVDIENYDTHFVNLSEDVRRRLDKQIRLKSSSYFFTVSEIHLRKEIIAMLHDSGFASRFRYAS